MYMAYHYFCIQKRKGAYRVTFLYMHKFSANYMRNQLRKFPPRREQEMACLCPLYYKIEV